MKQQSHRSHSRRSLIALGTALALASPLVLMTAANAAPESDGLRVIITTDGETDDQASMHRLLLYTNELDIEAIVSSSSRWHWAGDPTANPPIPPNRWSGTDGGHDWIPQLIDGGYRDVYPNLVAHDPDYPDPDDLLSKVYVGNITNQGEMTKNTPGSEAIKDILLEDDPTPISLQAWGGTNTIAAALRAIEDEYANTPEWASVQKMVSDKAEIYIIQDQDVTYKQYIAPTWPDVKTVMNRDQFEAFAYSWAAQNPDPLVKYFQKDWVAANLLSGPFMASYPLNAGTGNWFSEGDSPSFLHTIPTGLRQFEDPSFGGWGGRFVQVSPSLWADDPRYVDVDKDAAHDCSDYPLLALTLAEAAGAGSDQLVLSNRRVGGGVHGQNQIFAGSTIKVGSGSSAETRTITTAQMASRPYTVTLDEPVVGNYPVGASAAVQCSTFWPQARWAEDIQLDFAARVAWTVTDNFADANHAPMASVNEGLDLVAFPGRSVTLNAALSDPDGNAVNAKWWNYVEAGTYGGEVELSSDTGTSTSLLIPEDAAPGQTIHVILEAKDNGTPVMTKYQRVIITVGSPAGEDGIPLFADVPELGGPEGSLTLSIANYGAGVKLTGPTNTGDRFRFEGALPSITVTDTRNNDQAGNTGWSVAGRATQFTSQNAKFSSANLGWAPWTKTARDGVKLGDQVEGAMRSGPGLAIPQSLISAPNEARLGIASAEADLRLEIPVDTPDGNYQSNLTISLFPTD